MSIGVSCFGKKGHECKKKGKDKREDVGGDMKSRKREVIKENEKCAAVLGRGKNMLDHEKKKVERKKMTDEDINGRKNE